MSKVFLGDIAKERRETCKGSKKEYPIVGLEHLTPEEITLSAWDEDKDNTFTKLFCEGDVLFGRRRAYLKKAAVAPFDGICSGDITVVEAIPDKILPELLPFVIQNDALFDFAVGKSAGSLSPRVKWEHLKNYKFELPDIDKQRELAKVLWSMDATKRAYQHLLQKTDELVKSQFIEMFGNPATNPLGWKQGTMSDIIDGSISNGFFAKQNAYHEHGNVGVISVGDVVNRKYSNTSSLRRTDATETDIRKFHVKYGDMLFCRSSLVKIGIGKASIVPQNVPQNTLFECHVIRVPLNLEICIPEFMQVLSTTDYFRGQMMAKSKTATMTTIGQDVIQGTTVFIPPLAEQKRFVDLTRQSDKSKLELEQALIELIATYKEIISENLV